MRLIQDRPVRSVGRHPHSGRPRPGRRSGRRPAGQLLVIALALAAVVAGSMVLADRLRDSTPPLASQVTLHGLQATLATAGWVPMDAHTMDQGGGFQMPAQMMPGAPEGDQMRLGVPITLLNTDRSEQRFNLAEEFTVVGGTDGGPVALHSDTFGLLRRLAPGSAVNGVLYFDLVVPSPTDPPLVLRWVRDADTVEIAIPMAGGTPADPHQHD